MSSSFHLQIITPKGIYLDKEVDELYLKTSLGYMGILKGHDTLITGVEIASGFIKINDKKDFYAIFNGVLNVTKDVTKLIVSNIEHGDIIDLERAKKAQERASKKIKDKGEGIDIARAELALKRAIARIQSVNKSIL